MVECTWSIFRKLHVHEELKAIVIERRAGWENNW